MSTAPCLSGVTEEGTMISNLPLLFADGYPSCLETITEEQLEKFVPFMIRCSKGHSVGNTFTTPKWWPEDIPFMLPLIKPQGLETKWIAVLKSLVCRCYTYHGCEFMLRFCTELTNYPKSRLKFDNDWAGTSSLYDKESNKLLVTFRDENRFYDKKKETPRKSLLPRAGPMISPSKVRVSPLFPDIYLCDNCDAEFKTLDEVKNHEMFCCQEPEVVLLTQPEVILEDLSTHQEMFLNYFELLRPASLEQMQENPVKETSQYKRRTSASVRYAAIPLSSPLGIILNKKTRNSDTMFEVVLERTERYCSGTSDSSPRTRERNVNEPWPVTWKPSQRKDDINAHDWTHVYNFPTRQFRSGISMGLNAKKKSKVIFKQLQNCRVKLRRLSKLEIELYTSKGCHHNIQLTRNLIKIHNHVEIKKSGKIENAQNSLKVKNSHSCTIIEKTLKVQNSHHYTTIENVWHSHKIESAQNSCKIVNAKNSRKFANRKYSVEMVDISISEDECIEVVPEDVVSPVNMINPLCMPAQLVPNTLYSYDENLMLTKSTADPVASDVGEITLIDLCSSDEESEMNTVQMDYDVLNSTGDSVANSEILSPSVKQCGELNSSPTMPLDENHVTSSTFVPSHPPELFEIFTPRVRPYFPHNEPGAFSNIKASKTTLNVQTKPSRVPVSMLENQPVTNRIVTKNAIKQYEGPNRTVRRSGLRTRNCDDVSKRPRVPHGFIPAGGGTAASVQDKKEPLHWTPEHLTTPYYILSPEK